MAVTLTLEDQTVAALTARARAAGLSIEDYLRELVGQPPLPPTPAPVPAAGSVDNLHAALSELLENPGRRDSGKARTSITRSTPADLSAARKSPIVAPS